MKLIEEEFSELKKDWHNIYQWKKCMSVGYTEEISELLLRDFDKIDWFKDGLRKENFKQASHKGYCKLNTDITQFTEKRFCRALYNGNPLEHLGKIIDYEIPLTEPKQGQGKQNHGDIDLLSQRDNHLFFIEAKKHKSKESLLKAILEIFVYTFRLHYFKMINTFKQDYNCSESTSIVPVVLTFGDSSSGKQIKEINKYPNLILLLKRINTELNTLEIKNIEFYLIDDFIIENSLRTITPYNENSIDKNYKIELNKPIFIRKCQI